MLQHPVGARERSRRVRGKRKSKCAGVLAMPKLHLAAQLNSNMRHQLFACILMHETALSHSHHLASPC